METDRTRLAFVGTGVMGGAMAGRLMDAGYALTVHNRSRDKAEELLAAGAQWADSPAEAASDADAVLTIVGFPQDVENVYMGSADHPGILDAAPSGALLVDLTTSRPSLAARIAEIGAQRELQVLDAPVSGGDVGARDGTLSIMVGGESSAFKRARPLLTILGRTVVHQGPAGAGQHTKMCNQITIASNMLGVMEALLYARGSGLDPERVLESIGAGAAASWSLSNLYPRALEGDMTPGFYVEHFIKDLGIAVTEAEAMGLALPGLSQALDLYRRLAEGVPGGSRMGTQALILVLEAMAERRAPADLSDRDWEETT